MSSGTISEKSNLNRFTEMFKKVHSGLKNAPFYAILSITRVFFEDPKQNSHFYKRTQMRKPNPKRSNPKRTKTVTFTLSVMPVT